MSDDLNELQRLELKEAFDEFDKVIMEMCYDRCHHNLTKNSIYIVNV